MLRSATLFRRNRDSFIVSIGYKLCLVSLFTLGVISSFRTAQAVVTTDTLPKGVRALGLVYGFAGGVNSGFASDGTLETLDRPMNRSITLEDIKTGLKGSDPKLAGDIGKLQSALNAMSPDQIGDKMLVANMYGNINVNEERYVTGLLWGISNRFSAGVVVPVIHRRTSVEYKMEVTNNAKAIQSLVGNSGSATLNAGIQQLADAKVSPERFTNSIFTSSGYQSPGTADASGTGDIELQTRYRFFESGANSLAMRGTVVLPTASHSADITSLVDRDFGKHSYAAQLGLVHSLQIVPNRLSYHTSIFGKAYVPTKLTRAFAKNSDEPLPDLTDPNTIETVDYTYGPGADLDTGVMWEMWQGMLSLTGSYQYSVKGRDYIHGSRGLDYARLVDNDHSGGYMTSHGMEFTLTFSTVPLFKANISPVPAVLAFTWNQPLLGSNTIYSPYGRLDAILFF